MDVMEGRIDSLALVSGVNCFVCNIPTVHGKEKCTFSKASNTLHYCWYLISTLLCQMELEDVSLQSMSRSTSQLTLCSNGEGMKGGCILLSFRIGSNSIEINGASQHKMNVKEPGLEVIN